MVAGEVKKAKVRLLQDMVVAGEPRKKGDEVELSEGDARIFVHGKRAELVSLPEIEKFPAVGSVAAPVVETVEVEVENYPVNDKQHLPVDVATPAQKAAQTRAANKAAAQVSSVVDEQEK